MIDTASLAIRCLNIVHPLVLPDSNVVTEQLSAMLKTEVRREANIARKEKVDTTRRSVTTTRPSDAFSDNEEETVSNFQRSMKGHVDEQERRCCSAASSAVVGPSSRNNKKNSNDAEDAGFLKDKLSNLAIHSNNSNISASSRTVSTDSTTAANTSSSRSSSFDDVNLGRPGGILVYPQNNSSHEPQQEGSRNDGCCSEEEETREKNALYRLRMSEWAYRIIDHFGASRENVAISFEYLDRFYASGLYECKTSFDYKLVSITALYIALKVHNRTTIKASTLSSLSRGEITVGDIISMESLMLDALSYHLCPPTCYTFISLFYAFVPVSVRQSAAGHPLMQHAVYLTELSVMDVSFRSLKASHIALAAMLNVMEMMGEETMPSWARCHFIRDVEECMLKVALEQESKNVTIAGDYNGDDCDGGHEEQDHSSSSLSQLNQQHNKKIQFRKLLWQSVHKIQEMLWSLLSHNHCMDQENVFFFSTRNERDSLVVVEEEGRDDAPTGRT